MGKSVAVAIGSGIASAMLWLSAAAGWPSALSMPLLFLAPLPLLVAGLALGATMTAVAALAGAGMVAVLGNLAGAEVFGGFYGLSSWLIVRQGLLRRQVGGREEWSAIGTVAASLALLIAAAFLIGAVLTRADGGLQEVLRQKLQAVPAESAAFDVNTALQVIEPVLFIYFGLVGLFWQILMVANSVLAQSLLQRRKRALRPTPRWSDVRAPNWLSWLWVGCALLALIASGEAEFIAQNLVVILAGPFFFAGLAVIHRRSRGNSARTGMLVGFYFLLFMLFLVVAPVVAVVGMVESWTGSGHGGPPAGDKKGS